DVFIQKDTPCLSRFPYLRFPIHTSSRVPDPRNPVECQKKRVPDRPLLRQCLLAGRRQLVVTLAPLVRFFDPPAFDESFFLQPIECWIKGSDMEIDLPIGPLFDQAPDLIPVPRTLFQQSQNQHFSASPFEFSKQ